MPFFSIVIPAYNTAAYIEATLTSVAEQSFHDFEVIVVDDGSTDDTAVRAARFPFARVVTQNNQGPGAARNFGVGLSSGQYIAFLDSDDLWFPWTLSTIADIIDLFGAPELISLKIKEFHDERELGGVCKAPMQIDLFSDYLTSSSKNYFVGSCMMVVSKRAFLAAGDSLRNEHTVRMRIFTLRLGLVKGFAQISAPLTLGYRNHAHNARKQYKMIYDGVVDLLENERSGIYPPPGEARRRERWRVLTMYVRPTSLECLERGCFQQAWTLYKNTFLMHVVLGRFKYLAGFPLLYTLALARSCVSPLGFDRPK